ncbi:hypothetical protein HDK90DRAFT_531717, partial [Phyllosticta capitalensis]
LLFSSSAKALLLRIAFQQTQPLIQSSPPRTTSQPQLPLNHNPPTNLSPCHPPTATPRRSPHPPPSPPPQPPPTTVTPANPSASGNPNRRPRRWKPSCWSCAPRTKRCAPRTRR